MADTSPQSTPVRSLARERMIWALKPLGFLLLVLWVLHPGIADRADHTRTALIGFLLGAVYGFIVCGGVLRRHIRLRQPEGRQQPNRVPEEYYWGRVDEVMFENK